MPEERATILVVDDSEEVREFYEFTLKEAGYAVRTASNGDEAFLSVKEQRPDLIVLDVAMPVMDGLEFLTKIRSDLAPPIPPVLLNSGFELTEAEALRRGALMFIPKPVAPETLRTFAAQALRGRVMSKEAIAEHRGHCSEARVRCRRAAEELVQRMRANATMSRATFDESLMGQLGWIARYFGVETTGFSSIMDGRLQIIDCFGTDAFAAVEDIAANLPLCDEILETGSSLMVADTDTHPSFTKDSFPPGARFFAGVPVVAPENVAVGVLFLLGRQARTIPAEDILILEQLARIGSLTLALLADGRALAELPTTLKAGLVLRRTFELLLDAELRLLQRTGGSLELVAIEVDDPQRVTEALRTAEHQTRLVAGFLDRRRVAIFARDTGDGAEGTIAAVVRTLGAGRPLRAAGATAVSGKGLPPLAGFDLLRLAEIALDQAELTGGRQRLSLHHEISQSVYPS